MLENGDKLDDNQVEIQEKWISRLMHLSGCLYQSLVDSIRRNLSIPSPLYSQPSKRPKFSRFLCYDLLLVKDFQELIYAVASSTETKIKVIERNSVPALNFEVISLIP